MYEPKSYQENREHFIERLKERYELEITPEEYDNYCNSNNGTFHGFMTKNSLKTVGWIMMKGKKVYVLRRGEINCLATCYPPSVEFSYHQMLLACFSGKLRSIVRIIYRKYIQECQRIEGLTFPTAKEAWFYYSENTFFATLHIEKYKFGFVRTEKLAYQVDLLIKNKNEYVFLDLVKRKNKRHEPTK